jgi:signal peptidase II|tara:strand:+ start:404 stop:886 length:483 start_codon:yes stop_codon:yes gene_type:complete
MKFIKSSILLKISIIFLIFILDRISKTYVINLFNETQFEEIYLLNFLNIYFIWNEGIAFGLLNFDNDLIYNSITLLIILISLTILYLAFKNRNYTGYFFAMILGGSLGNLFDRIKFSAVPDFIDIHIGNYHWFIFNVADIFISLGIICLIFVELFYNKKI